MESDLEREDIYKAQKDPKHFEVLYAKYFTSIRNYIRSKVTSEDVSEDLTSQTFMKALEKIALFRWQGVSFKSWLYRIARNTVYDYFRSAAVRTARSIPDSYEDTLTDDLSLERDLLHDEREIKLFETIATFSSNDQYLLYYRYFEGLSVEEIAQLTKLSKVNVATRLHRIRKEMEARMNVLLPSPESEPSKKD